MNTEQHSERAHSAIGASSAYRWMACPGSIRESEGIESKTSPYAEEGTAAHELGEVCLLDNTDAIAHIGETFNGYEVTEEMADAVQVYLDVVRRRLEETDGILHVEKKFNLDWLYPGMFGTNDVCIEEPFGKLTVIDYKHGAGVPVSPHENAQLMYYGLGASHGEDFEEVELVIVQPRAYAEGEAERVWATTPERLEEFAKELKAAVFRTRRKTAKLVTGSHCRFCPAKVTCPEVHKQNNISAMKAFDPVNSEKAIVLPDPKGLTPKQMKRVLDGEDLLKSWLSSVREYAFDYMEKGKVVPGYKLVKKTKHRIWKSGKDIADELQKQGVYGVDMYAPQKLKTPAQMETAICKSGVTKSEGKEFVAELCEKPDGGHSLVPISNSKPAVTIQDVQSVFSPIE